jgi:hypothetical protein
MFAKPVRTVFLARVCGFCDDDATYFAYCDIQLAVLACPKHIECAKKSKNVWLGQNGRVWFKDIKDEPLFAQTDILTQDIVVKRSPKMVEGVLTSIIDVDGWKIRKPFAQDDGALTVCIVKGQWMVNVVNIEEDAAKWIPMHELKMSLVEDNHAFVDEMIAKLAGNIYKTDLDQFVIGGYTYFYHDGWGRVLDIDAAKVGGKSNM